MAKYFKMQVLQLETKVAKTMQKKQPLLTISSLFFRFSRFQILHWLWSHLLTWVLTITNVCVGTLKSTFP